MSLLRSVVDWLRSPVQLGQRGPPFRNPSIPEADSPAPARSQAPPKAPPPRPAPPVLTDVIEASREPGPVRMDRLRAQLILHEGMSRTIYPDTEGHPTIGIGRNLDAKSLNARELLAIGRRDLHQSGLSDSEIDMLFRRDVAESVAALDRHLPWWRRLDEVRRRVLLDMMFNMGPGAPGKGGLLSFVNTLENIRTGFYREAADGMLASKWARQTKTRADRLAAMMRTGQDWAT